MFGGFFWGIGGAIDPLIIEISDSQIGMLSKPWLDLPAGGRRDVIFDKFRYVLSRCYKSDSRACLVVLLHGVYDVFDHQICIHIYRKDEVKRTEPEHFGITTDNVTPELRYIFL